VDRRAAPSRPQTDPPGPTGLPAQRRPIEALIAVIGIALAIFGLIEAELRACLGDGVALPGILPEGRAAKPTARAALAAFEGLSVTYTPAGLVLDRLTQVQRIVLALLGVSLPWPESKEE